MSIISLPDTCKYCVGQPATTKGERDALLKQAQAFIMQALAAKGVTDRERTMAKAVANLNAAHRAEFVAMHRSTH